MNYADLKHFTDGKSLETVKHERDIIQDQLSRMYSKDVVEVRDAQKELRIMNQIIDEREGKELEEWELLFK